MFPPKGYFASFVCPFYLTGFCDRQHCHFRHSDRSQSSDEVLLKEIICEENKVLHEKQLRDELTSSFTNRVVKDNLTEKAGEDRNHVEQQKGISYKATPIEELQMMSFPTTKPFYSHSSEKTNVKDEESKDQNTSESTNLNNLIVVDHCYTSPLANPQRESNLTFLKNKTFSLECGLQNHSFIPFVKESEIIANSLGFQSHKNEKEKESKQLSKPCKDSNKSLSRIEKEEKHRKEISGKKDNKESRKTSKQTTDHEMGKSEKIRKTEENLENIYGLNKHKSSSQSSDEMLLKEIIHEENKSLCEKQLRDALSKSFIKTVVKENLGEKARESTSHVVNPTGAVKISCKATSIEGPQNIFIPFAKFSDSHSSEMTYCDVKDEESKARNTSEPSYLNHVTDIEYNSTLPMANPQRMSKLIFFENETFTLECKKQNHSCFPFVEEIEIIANSLGFQSHKNEKEFRQKSKTSKSLSRIKKNKKLRKEIIGKKDCKEKRNATEQITENAIEKCEKTKQKQGNLDKICELTSSIENNKPNLSEDNDFEDLFKPKKEKKHHKEKKHKKERSEKKLEEEIKHKKIISKVNEKLKRKEDCLKNINCGLNKDNKSISTPESKLSDDNSTDNLFKVYKEKRHKKKSSDKEPKEKIKSKQIVSKDNDKKVKKKGEGLKNMSGLINPSLPIFKPENEMKAKEKSSSRINKQMENTCNSESVIIVDSEPEMDTEENVKSKKRTKSEILFPMFSSNQSKESDNGNKNTNKASLTSVPFTASKVQDEDYLLDNRVQSRKKTRVSLGYTWRPPPKKRVEVMTPAQRIALFRKLKENKEKGLPG